MKLKKLLLLAVSVLVLQQTNAQDLTSKGKCKQGNCRKGFGIIVFQNGDRYEGEWRDGNMDGQGTYYHANGATYIGSYKNGERHGFGTYRWPEGDLYIGEYAHNNKEGCGQYFFSKDIGKKGVTQSGYFSNNKFIGSKPEYCPPSAFMLPKEMQEEYNSYQESNDRKDLNNGTCMKGDCKNNYGVYLFFNGDRYEGDFKNGMKHGQGTYTTKNGDTYQGMYKDDRRHGYGTYRWANGAIFIGEYEYGKRNGKGQFIDEYGTIQEGYYADNKYIGPINGNEQANNEIPNKPAIKEDLNSTSSFGWLNPAQNGQSVNGCCFIVEACVATKSNLVKVKIFNNDEVVATLTAKDIRKGESTCQSVIRHPILLHSGENNLYFKVEDESKATVFSQPILIHKGSE